MKITGRELIEYIEKLSEELGKIFIQDQFDEAIANSVVNFASRQIQAEDEWVPVLLMAVERYVVNSGYTVTIKDFGNNIPNVFQKIKLDYESKKRFDALVKQTQDRMMGHDI
jgi:hypothetical protein